MWNEHTSDTQKREGKKSLPCLFCFLAAEAAKSSGSLTFWLFDFEYTRSDDETDKNWNIFCHKSASAHPLPFGIMFRLVKTKQWVATSLFNGLVLPLFFFCLAKWPDVYITCIYFTVDLYVLSVWYMICLMFNSLMRLHGYFFYYVLDWHRIVRLYFSFQD